MCAQYREDTAFISTVDVVYRFFIEQYKTEHYINTYILAQFNLRSLNSVW